MNIKVSLDSSFNVGEFPFFILLIASFLSWSFLSLSLSLSLSLFGETQLCCHESLAMFTIIRVVTSNNLLLPMFLFSLLLFYIYISISIV